MNDKCIGQMFLYVYRKKALLIVLSRTDPEFYDIPCWPFKGDVTMEIAERLLADYFAHVVVTRVTRRSEDSYICEVESGTHARPGSVLFFGTSHNLDFHLTDRAREALSHL